MHIEACSAQAKEKRQAKEAQLAKAQMDAARRGGVSWGMAEEAALEEDLDSVTEGTMLGITTMLVWSSMSLTPHTCTATCALHVSLLCQGLFIRDGAVSQLSPGCDVLLLLSCLNVTAAAITCSTQCLYKSSALDTLEMQLLAGLLRVTEDSNIVKVSGLQQRSLWCTAYASLAIIAVIVIS